MTRNEAADQMLAVLPELIELSRTLMKSLDSLGYSAFDDEIALCERAEQAVASYVAAKLTE